MNCHVESLLGPEHVFLKMFVLWIAMWNLFWVLSMYFLKCSFLKKIPTLHEKIIFPKKFQHVMSYGPRKFLPGPARSLVDFNSRQCTFTPLKQHLYGHLTWSLQVNKCFILRVLSVFSAKQNWSVHALDDSERALSTQTFCFSELGPFPVDNRSKRHSFPLSSPL